MNFHKPASRLFIFLMLLAIVALAAFGCAPAVELTPTPTATTPPPTATLAPPQVRITQAPDPLQAAEIFLDAWTADDYPAMYALLTADAKSRIDEAAFTKRYLDVVANAAVPTGGIAYSILDTELHQERARVTYQVTLTSVLFGAITRDTQMHLQFSGDGWRIAWDDAMILPELAGGNRLQIVNYVPPRGDIYDRNGEPLVGIADAYTIGLIPDAISAELEDDLLEDVARASGYPPEYISSLYNQRFYGPGEYMPLTDVLAGTNLSGSGEYDAVYITEFTSRYYFLKEAGSQTLGYTSAIQPEEVTNFMRSGYMWTERVPRMGIEQWGESYLGGSRGGTLYLYDQNGNVLSILAEKTAAPAYTVYTTLDKDLQKAAHQALFGFNGAVVVLEKNTGRVLAMASSPGFNPNLFEPTNYNAIFDSPLFGNNAPLFNRASQGQYPLGSVFKIITLAAALESGRFTAESTYQCEHEFTELSGVTLYDWTYWDEVAPSGLLSLPQGLMRSCNPWFWHIGVDFYNNGMANKIPEMARGFGLGSPTGIQEVPENAGQVVEPTEPLAATNLAIGQGDLLVTPLQVARFVAAVGNGGTLYRPQLIEKIVSITGEQVFTFTAEANGTLPISPETLATIQGAMTEVVRNQRGTAYRTLGSFRYDIAGKTSTSETGIFDPDAWFVSYSFENLADKPDIVVIALVEQSGEGADYGAPVVRRILEVYFFGSIRTSYPWEIRIGVPEFLVPTPEPTSTPGP